MNKFKTLLLSLVLIITTLLTSCAKENDKNTDPISRTELFMGTVVRITIYDSTDESILDKAFNRVAEIESLVSINEDGTELDEVNANSGIQPIAVSDTTYTIVKKALEYSKLSNGDFDLTIGPLVKLWSIGLEGEKVPTQEEIDSVLPLINYKNVELDDNNKTIYLKEKGMIIDLGSIAKGYAADEISKILTENNVNSAIIDLGGNVLLIGSKADGSDYNIGIQKPFDELGEPITSVKISDHSLVTTGIYQRYFEKDGKLYHHILDPNTGYPCENNLYGVTIITDSSLTADALSTTCFLLGFEKGMNLVNKLDNVDAIFITDDNEIHYSKNFLNKDK